MQASSHDPAGELLGDMRAFMASGGGLPAMDERRVRQVCDAIRAAESAIDTVAGNPFADLEDPFYAGAIAYLDARRGRDERCLLSYLKWRMDTISELWWQDRDGSCYPNLSQSEKGFLKDYNALMVGYMSSFDHPLDLRAYSWRAPAAQVLEVRGLRDYSFVSSTTGHVVSIYAGKQCCVSSVDAEALLRQEVVALSLEK